MALQPLDQARIGGRRKKERFIHKGKMKLIKSSTKTMQR
jgi:hypothetical protein